MNPILLDLPMPIQTPRLTLRGPRPGDGAAVNAAVLESFEDLREWMPWATERPSLAASEENIRRACAAWILREDLRILAFDRATGALAASSGLHRIRWGVPSFEIGYWVRSSYAGRGLAGEITNALTRFAFGQLGARRVELRCAPDNTRSLRVIRKLGFEQEGLLRADTLGPSGPRDTVVFSRMGLEGLPTLDVRW